METRAKRAKQLAFNNGAWVMWGLVLQFVPRDEVNDVLCISRNLHDFLIPIQNLKVFWYGNALTAIQRKTMVGIGKLRQGNQRYRFKTFERNLLFESLSMQSNHRQGIGVFEINHKIDPITN